MIRNVSGETLQTLTESGRCILICAIFTSVLWRFAGFVFGNSSCNEVNGTGRGVEGVLHFLNVFLA